MPIILLAVLKKNLGNNAGVWTPTGAASTLYGGGLWAVRAIFQACPKAFITMIGALMWMWISLQERLRKTVNYCSFPTDLLVMRW